jgi:hypothetical protein
MDWYFRYPFRAKFLYTNASSGVLFPMRVTLYRLGNTILALGYLLARAIKRQDDRFISTIELIAGGLGLL